eukprot:3047155-Amphidinium_carterae.1
MASTVSVHSTPMEEAFGDWSGTGEAPARPTLPDQSVEGSWTQVPLNSGYTMATDVGTQQYLNPALQLTLRNRSVNGRGWNRREPSPVTSPIPPCPD